VFANAGLSLESALLPEGELTVPVCSTADAGLRSEGEKFSLFSAGILSKWTDEKFCFLRGTMTSSWPEQATR